MMPSRFLRQCRQVLDQDSRLLVIERTWNDSDKLQSAIRDLTMLVLFGSNDRTPAMYEALLRSAGLTTVGENIYNDTMSPFDREFGRALGNVLTAEPFVTFPMGGVEDHVLRDHLLSMARLPAFDDLQSVKAKYGKCYYEDSLREAHITYMRFAFRDSIAGFGRTLFRCI